jgi:hypothetical protein
MVLGFGVWSVIFIGLSALACVITQITVWLSERRSSQP